MKQFCVTQGELEYNTLYLDHREFFQPDVLYGLQFDMKFRLQSHDYNFLELFKE